MTSERAVTLRATACSSATQPPWLHRLEGANVTPIHPTVRLLMEKHAATPEQLAVLVAHHATVVNVDATLIAEAPKIAPHIAAMRANIAHTLQLETNRISIKATTNEGLGTVGRGEGMAAMAVAAVLMD